MSSHLYPGVPGKCARGVAGGHDKIPYVRPHVLRYGKSAHWAVGSGEGLRAVSVFRPL